MRFSFFVTSASVGGAQVFCSRLANLLSVDGHECHLVSGFSPPDCKAFERAFTSPNSSAFASHFIISSLQNSCSLLDDLITFLRILFYIFCHRDHIIITNSGKVSFFVRLCCILSFKRCFFVVHGWSYSGWIYRPIRLLYFFAELILDVTDLFFCQKIFVSYFDRKTRPVRLLNFFKRDFVVHNDCIDMRLLFDAANPLSLDASLLNILSVARLSPQKNFSVLLEVLSLRPFYRLYLVGDGPDRSRIYDLAVTLGVVHQIIFLGELSLSELVPYYKACDVFSLISFWEGFPISTLEAMSLSKPVVVSDVGGCSEIFEYKPSLPFGFLIPSVNPLPHLLAAFDSYFYSNELLIEHSLNSRFVYDEAFSFNKKSILISSILLNC